MKKHIIAFMAVLLLSSSGFAGEPLSTRDAHFMRSIENTYTNLQKRVEGLSGIEIDNTQTGTLLDSDYKRLLESFSKFQHPEHPDIVALRAKVDELGAVIANKKKGAEGERSDADALMAELELVREQYLRSFQYQKPFTADGIEQWATMLRTSLDGLPRAQELVKRAQTELPLSYQDQNFKNLLRNMDDSVPKRIDNEVQLILNEWRAKVSRADGQFLGETILANPERVETTDAIFQEALDALAFQSIFETNYHGASSKETEDSTVRILKKREELLQGQEEVIRRARMPKDSGYANLVQIAREVIAKAEGIGPIERIVTNVPMTKNLRETRYDGDGVFVRLVWDEFTVVVAEKDGDKYWIRPVKLKFYHEGPARYTQKKWFIHNTWRKERILKENIAK